MIGNAQLLSTPAVLTIPYCVPRSCNVAVLVLGTRRRIAKLLVAGQGVNSYSRPCDNLRSTGGPSRIHGSTSSIAAILCERRVIPFASGNVLRISDVSRRISPGNHSTMALAESF